MPHGATDDQVARLLAFLEQRAPRPFTIQEMADAVRLERYDRRHLRSALDAQAAARRLRRIGKTRYQWRREPDGQPRPVRPAAPPRGGGRRVPRIEGRYARVQAGYGFVEALGRAADRYHRDILVPRGEEGAAMHGDRVEVEIVRRDARLRRVVGRVTTVLTPVHRRVIGKLERLRDGWAVTPQNDLLPPVLLVGEPVPGRDREGLVALVTLTRPPAPGRLPEGRLERVLGTFDDPEVQFLAIVLEHGLRLEHPPAVEAEASRLPTDPVEADFRHRRDLRSLPFVTIDGETARDFDDAVCLVPDGEGQRLWVAIADVSHYVRPGSPLDREAALRGTSVYFPDRAIPMLPPRLSTGLCSLNPGRPRLVLAAELLYDARGRRVRADFYRAVIESRARLTYTRVAAVLSRADTPEIRRARAELGELIPMLARMRELMRVLYRDRIAAGSLDLDLPDAVVDLSEEGRSIGIGLAQRNDAHRLIEEFMLEANRAVATFLQERDVPLPYRIHEPPDPDDADELNGLLGPFGLRLDYDGRVEPRCVQRLLRQLDGHPLARVLTRQVLRSLTQAQYSTGNAGHFGLAFPIYCHFTSPIRRYPDLLVHRQLGRVFDGEVDAARAQAAALEEASVESSRAEREAMEAERAMLDLKKAEFMLGHLLEPTPGTIVSVLKFGMFVELEPYPVEGLVRIDDLADDRYRFVEEDLALVGLRTRRRHRLGDRVLVEATNVSLERRQIELRLLERLGGAANAGRAGTPRKPSAGRPRGKARRRRPRAV